MSLLMQRIVWLGYLFGMLLLLATAQSIALAAYNTEGTKSEQYAAFQEELVRRGASKSVIKYHQSIYDLLSITELSTSYRTIKEMQAALDSGWEKEKVSYQIADEPKTKAAGEALQKTPMMGSHKSSSTALAKPESAPYLLMVFFSSNPRSMSEHVTKLRQWLEHKVAKEPFVSNIMLITSYSIYHSRDEIRKSNFEPMFLRFLNNKFPDNNPISQNQLANEVLRYYFDSWSIIKEINIPKGNNLLDELKKQLPDQESFNSFTDIALVSPQPFCRLTELILLNKFPGKESSFHHSCHDEKRNHSILNIEEIAERLDAFKDWINAENEYNQNTQY